MQATVLTTTGKALSKLPASVIVEPTWHVGGTALSLTLRNERNAATLRNAARENGAPLDWEPEVFAQGDDASDLAAEYGISEDWPEPFRLDTWTFAHLCGYCDN